MSDEYTTVSGPGEGKYTEKMSRFLSFAYHVGDAEEARARIAEVARRYHDARHVCWAYMLGPERLNSMSNDNGEPSGTAGKPILGQINSMGLTDVVVAVVRYFGGIKLGTSGLIVAYREAARLALEAAPKELRHVEVSMSFTFPYMSVNAVMKLIKQPGVITDELLFDNACRASVRIRRDDADRLRSRLSDVDGLTFV